MTALGTCDPKFEPVRDALTGLLEGADVGASAAVVHEGRLVADVWGGFCDEERTRPWEADTITNVWSTTKTMCNLSALVLADRDELDVDESVATYWPEFKANGKEDVKVRHLLSHSAGLPGWSEPITIADLYDWDKVCGLLAADAPWWEPGTASGYHALTQGNLVGEVVRRVTGQSLGTFFAENLAAPLDADFHIGLADEHHGRVANVIPPPEDLTAQINAAPDSIPARAMKYPGIGAEASWTPEWRRAEIPAGGGHGNARSVALVQSILSCGGETNGVRVMSAEGCELALRKQVEGTDLVLGVPLTLGTGYGLPGELLPLPNDRICFWGGWGGSLVINDLENNMTVSYVMNKMGEGTTGDFRAGAIIAAAYQSLMS